MKYTDYEAIANEVTAETALETVQKLLDQARTDSVETDSEIADLTNQLNEMKSKYNDLQVDYIKKLTSQPGEVEDEEDEESDINDEIEKILKEEE